MNDPITPGKGPMKVLVDSFHCRVMNGLHVVSFGSGEDEFRFVMQLPASKTFARALMKQIQEIEKKSGKEIADLGLSDEPVISPIRIDDGEENSK